MGFYAQQNYPQHLGASNSVTISQAGCLLTSIANGLLKITGSAPDPATLNQFFICHGAYTWDAADKAKDDLGWGSISLYDPTFRLTKVGSGSLPDSSIAMVKFYYNSVQTGDPIDHYCWVDHIEGRDVYIIDSWDGLIKGPGGYQGVYHLPVAWATFERVPIAAPPTPIPTPASYQVTENYPDGKRVRLNKQPTKLWGMNYHFDYMKDHPVETHDLGEIVTVTNKVHHEDGYDYYRRDGQVDGFNVLDCDDYVPPPPPAPAPPSAPATFPSAYEPYWLRTTIKWYPTALSARNDMNARGTISQGNYLTYRADGDMLCLVREKGGEQYWINPADNVEPTPEPVVVAPAPVVVTPAAEAPTISQETAPADNSWKVTHSMRGDGKPVWFVSTNTDIIKLIDLEGKSDIEINLHPGTELGIVQWFVKDGVKYYRDTKLRDHFWYFSLKADYLVEMPQVAFDANQDGRITFEDVPALMQGFIDYGSTKFRNTTKVVHDLGLPVKLSDASKKARQVIDGFSKGKKKDKVQ